MLQGSVIDIVGLSASPWKNGSGSTRTIAVWPDGAGLDDFIWRVSIADVTESGRFSLFPGVDRTILLLDGCGMILHYQDGSTHALTTPFELHTMSGEEPIEARLVNGPSRDFNVMVRRGRARASVGVWQSNTRFLGDGETGIFYCPRGKFGFYRGCREVASLPAEYACRISVPGISVIAVPQTPESTLISAIFELNDNKEMV